jgi:serine kinase of HPr protein (carbohydrate metabolism regulator)
VITVHGTCVAFEGEAILIRGKPGTGKSTLALELIETSGNGVGGTDLRAVLVSDDQTEIKDVDGQLWAVAPEKIRGKLEVRGLGIVDVPQMHLTIRQSAQHGGARLVLVVDLSDAAERFPLSHQTVEILGVTLPLLMFPPHAGALAARVRAGFARLKSAVAPPVSEA